MRRRSIAALLVVLGLAACSTGSGGATATPEVPAGGGANVGLASSAAGDHLAGSNGLALYVLSTDSANTSTCTGDCATNWPPATVSGGQAPVAGSGVTVQLGTMTRPDGTVQITANGMPLYAYGGDHSATDINGQGKGGVWFLAGPDGKAVGGQAATPSPTMPAGTDDDYY
jgi:predicted lipoprotein with Yx(FWY)xxD motif